MPFYIIEKQEQLNNISHLGDCFIHFITGNDNFHPKLQQTHLIYIHPLNNNKGYIFCINHTESFSLDLESVNSFLFNNTDKLFTLDKKRTMYFYKVWNKLYDINFISPIINNNITEICYDFYYTKYGNINNVNKLIPLSKHYEKYELIYKDVINIINNFNNINTTIYNFNNNELTEAYWKVESNGLYLNKNKFIEYFYNKSNFHGFNINKGKIYTSYFLYTKTSRPSNSFNNINFTSLSKNTGEREAFISENNYLIEFDYSAFHPHLAAKLCGLDIPNSIDIYDWLNMSKQDVFTNLYGGISEENLKHIYFKTIHKWICFQWQTNKYGITTKNRKFNWEKDNIDNMNKMLSYLLQSYETYYSVLTINKINDFLQNKKSKLVLTTFDSFLIDYNIEDGDISDDIQKIMEFPSKFKIGSNFNNLK